jgi:hypothetical protein
MDCVGLAGLSDRGHGRTQAHGAALTYARCGALFALVGIAGEDDLDAPDLLDEPVTPIPVKPAPQGGSAARASPTKKGLVAEESGTLRNQLVAEIEDLTENEEFVLWAQRKFGGEEHVNLA